ncbi:hypothetical protein ACWT_3659 [Actinoplanes sp. SE50]|uniref:pre-peptidase C-terminal domain-containing protein n=1 Tax=unclassified Actinoplanes TaxID=2626549 RepID=UPI00023EC626|nr:MULTISPECIES: pre-peptidase C-terminal domain-containing protein [unclassified Actinoplanes]AEV84682.1 peptidase S51, dipeptidase E [Actinoplanes sp. SE50/110]ATO83074.1 hypothetical protein ACWT_3659 [Actinoplanes sp. SE50]SLM00481.1 hypothetical protein ACSP50_3714 [Actinoplanes sp. SE50/110]
MTLTTPLRRRLTAAAALGALLFFGGVHATAAQAAVTRTRAGNQADVSRTGWNGPAFVFSGAGAIVPATFTRAVTAITGGAGTMDVVVLADAPPGSGSATPECDAVLALAGVNACTTLVLTSARDGDDAAVNTEIRNAEFVYFAGGDQCAYAAWKSTALRASVQSVVAKGGGVGGGSAGTHINSDIVYDACGGSVTSAEALADPYTGAVTFTTGMFSWPHYAGTINDSHFVTRDRMGRTMAFVARSLKDGLVTGGKAWGVGIEQGGSLFVDRAGLATLAGADAYIVLGDHAPEQAVAGRPLTYTGFKIWHLTGGGTFDFANRPTCGYYLRSVTAGVADPGLYSGTPIADCSGGAGAVTETEPNDSRGTANDLSTGTYPLTVSGSAKSASDRDYFKLSLTQNQKVTVSCSIPDQYDADLYLLDGSGAGLARSVNDGKGADERLTYTRTATGAGSYYLDVEAYSGSGTSPYACAVVKG